MRGESTVRGGGRGKRGEIKGEEMGGGGGRAEERVTVKVQVSRFFIVPPSFSLPLPPSFSLLSFLPLSSIPPTPSLPLSPLIPPFLAAEKHAKFPCVTVSVDDITFDTTVR